nr:phosphosulfolactate synthase [Natrialba asiatica]
MNVPEVVLERYGEYLDVVKLLDAASWAPDNVIRDDIRVQIGGAPGEVARMQGTDSEFLDRLEEASIDVVEYETHVDRPSVDEMRSEVETLRERGFDVVGEVGAKWFTRMRLGIRSTASKSRRRSSGSNGSLTPDARRSTGRGWSFGTSSAATSRIGRDRRRCWRSQRPSAREHRLRDLESDDGFSRVREVLVLAGLPVRSVGQCRERPAAARPSTRKHSTWNDVRHEPRLHPLAPGGETDEWWRMEVPPYDVGLERD